MTKRPLLSMDPDAALLGGKSRTGYWNGERMVEVPERIVVTIPGPPVAKGRPRMTRTGRAYTPARTRAAEGYMRHAISAQVGQPLLTGPLAVSVISILPIPASWPKKKQADAAASVIRPTGKPDADNLGKAVCDAANGLLWHDDGQIVVLTVTKAYGDKPGTVLMVEAAP
jgi:Holliday junction resolvase RusA-like endonuclease